MGAGECESACDGDALSYAAGEFLGVAAGGVGESDGGEVVFGESGEFASGAVWVGGHEGDGAEEGEVAIGERGGGERQQGEDEGDGHGRFSWLRQTA